MYVDQDQTIEVQSLKRLPKVPCKRKWKREVTKEKVNEVLEDYSYDCDSEEGGYEIGNIKNMYTT